jgi:hypothetical protein
VRVTASCWLKINADLGDLNCFKRLGVEGLWLNGSFLMGSCLLFGGEYGAFFVSFRCNKINMVSKDGGVRWF